MVFTKLVVASQALLLASAKDVLTPQSLNEQSRTELGKAEVQKIQLITSRMHEVVQKLNGFSKKLEEQTEKYLKKDQAELSAKIGNSIAALPTADENERPRWDRYQESLKWFDADPKQLGHDAVVSLTHVGIHAATALATTYLDGLVPSATNVLGNDYGRYNKGGEGWGAYFLSPLRDEVSGYMIPSMAKLLYHLIMDTVPLSIGGFSTGERSVWKKEQFRLPVRYALSDTWNADNVKTKDETATSNLKDGSSTSVQKFETEHIEMVPVTTGGAYGEKVKYVLDPEQQVTRSNGIKVVKDKIETVTDGGRYDKDKGAKGVYDPDDHLPLVHGASDDSRAK